MLNHNDKSESSYNNFLDISREGCICPGKNCSECKIPESKMTELKYPDCKNPETIGFQHATH